MELPPQPKDTEFDDFIAYSKALAAWERVCLAIIEAEGKRTESRQEQDA